MNQQVSGPFSDREEAMALAKKLLQRQRTSFSEVGSAPPVSKGQDATLPQGLTPFSLGGLSPKNRAEGWQAWLTWAKEQSHSWEQFICDHQGLMIAVLSGTDQDSLDETLSNLINGVHQLTRFGKPYLTPLVVHRREKDWLAGLTCPLEAGTFILVGLTFEQVPDISRLLDIRRSLKELTQTLLHP
jgi:hypothetical protein